MMIRVLAQIVFRQVCALKGRIPDEPDPPPALCPTIRQTPSISCAGPCAKASSPSAEISDADRWPEPLAQALVVLFTQLAQRHVQTARAQEDVNECGSHYHCSPRTDGLRLRAAINRCQQVNEHQESTERQYRLQERALDLGWPPTAIVVIDEDQGRSGSSATARTGFQRLVAEVSLGRVGVVLMLEASRLARNSSDWHQLIELCGLSHTRLSDEGAIYDPRDPNDRLLLGVKGTLSEAELFTLRTRLYEGRWNKARKGLLQFPLPVGYVRAPDGAWDLDPDLQVRERLAYLFEAFRRMPRGTAGRA